MSMSIAEYFSNWFTILHTYAQMITNVTLINVQIQLLTVDCVWSLEQVMNYDVILLYKCQLLYIV